MSALLKTILLPCSALVLGQAALAQQLPSAGSQLQQIQPAPVAPKAAPEIRIEQQLVGAASGEQARIRVDTLRVTGATVFAEADLLALTDFVAGQQLTLADLQRMAGRITQRYRQRGYFVAQAVVPAQNVVNNVVTIAVSEGRYGQIIVHNRADLRDPVAHGSLGDLTSGDVITLDPLESRLLGLSDVPGVDVSSTLVPGTVPGTSDLIVEVVPGRAFNGSVDADNAGNRYTGQYRIGATLDANNPLGLGDLASLRVLTSGSGLRYGHLSYQAPVGAVQVGVAYDWLDYSLRKEFRDLEAHGTAQVASVFGRYTVIRSRNQNLYALLAFDVKTFSDKVDVVPSVIDKRSEMVIAGGYGESRDGVGGGGSNAYGVTVAAGRLDIRTPDARALDEQSLRTEGGFGKVSFYASRLQSLGAPFSLPLSIYGSISGQLASKNLDISEKMELGGINGVRAYPEGEAYADQSAIVTAEGRVDVPKIDLVPGLLQGVAFVDAGNAGIDRYHEGTNRRTLSGAGLGVNWREPGNFAVRSYYAQARRRERQIRSRPLRTFLDRARQVLLTRVDRTI